MPLEYTQPPEVDLDRTDRLPVLAGTVSDEDVRDDAVRLDYTPATPSIKAEFAGPGRAAGTSHAAGAQASGAGASLPALSAAAPKVADEPNAAGVSTAESIPTADAQAPPRADFLRVAERWVASRNDSATLRGTLASEQARSRELERALAEKQAAEEAARSRLDETLREVDRYQNESRTLRSALATRDAAIGQVQRSLAERVAQLNALQREHAQVVPVLEERSRLSARLETELEALRASYESLYGELQSTQQSMVTLGAQLEGGKKELESVRRELVVAKAQSETYLEHLRTLEWRRGLDDKGTTPGDGASAALQEECDRLRAQAAETEAELAARDEAIAKLQAAAMDEESRRGRELQSAADAARAELSAVVKRLQFEAQAREDEHAVLLGQLAARRPDESTEKEVKRLSEELAAKTRALEQVSEDNRSIRAALERARTSLEERESRIRRLERSEAEVPTPVPMECTAELTRIDGPHKTIHTVVQRTRIGRAPGCELQIESTSVSRHHALLLLTNSREVVVEDLNSTNGVLVNGRRISRQLLNDGDILTIGEAQFRLSLKLTPWRAGRG